MGARRLTRRAFLGDCAAGAAAWAVGAAACGQDRAAGPDEPEAPGPPRVTWVRDPAAAGWDFAPGTRYWDAVDQGAVDGMMDAAVTALTGASRPAAAWRRVMASYRRGDVVAVKLNTNDANWGDDLIGALGEVAVAVARGLRSAGVPEDRIRFYDASRPGGGRMPAHIPDRTRAVYPAVGFLDTDTATYGTGFADEQVAYGGVRDDIANHLCAAQHLISMPLLKAVTPEWGTSGALKLHLGSVGRPRQAHESLYVDDPALNAAAVINANPHVRGKLRLVVADGLYGMDSGIHFPVDDPGENPADIPRPWRTFGGQAASCLLLAFDPVAIDSVMHDIVARERAARGLAPLGRPILQAAAAAGLGVHETAADLRYRGIDLVRIGV